VNGRVWSAALALAAVLACAQARAVAGETSAGLTLNATVGAHSEGRGAQSLPVVPVPVFWIEHREGKVALYLEGVPPIGPVALGGGDATKLSMLDGALRVDVAPRAWLGIGETIFDQQTTYANRETQSSRVVGARYEAGAIVWQAGSRRVDLQVDDSPTMRGRIVDAFPFGFSSTGGERASLVDAKATWSTTGPHRIFSAGLRWINYSAVFPNGATADENRLLTPFVGLAIR